MSTRTATLVAVATLGLLASACSSSGGDDAKATPLKDLVVQASDLPSSYKSEAADSDPNDDANDRAVAVCAGGTDPTASRVEKVDSPDFSSGPIQVSSTVNRVKSDDAVTQDAKLFSSAKLAGCLKKQFAVRAAADSSSSGLTVTKLTVVPGAGSGPSNQIATINATLSVKQSGKTLTAYVTEYAFKGPKLEADLTFTGVGAPVDSALQKQVLSAMAGRVAKG